MWHPLSGASFPSAAGNGVFLSSLFQKPIMFSFSKPVEALSAVSIPLFKVPMLHLCACLKGDHPVRKEGSAVVPCLCRDSITSWTTRGPVVDVWTLSEGDILGGEWGALSKGQLDWKLASLWLSSLWFIHFKEGVQERYISMVRWETKNRQT